MAAADAASRKLPWAEKGGAAERWIAADKVEQVERAAWSSWVAYDVVLRGEWVAELPTGNVGRAGSCWGWAWRWRGSREGRSAPCWRGARDMWYATAKSGYAARLLQRCEALGPPGGALIDRVGYMVGLRHEGGVLVTGRLETAQRWRSVCSGELDHAKPARWGLRAWKRVLCSLYELLLSSSSRRRGTAPADGSEGAALRALRTGAGGVPGRLRARGRRAPCRREGVSSTRKRHAALLLEFGDAIDPAGGHATIACALGQVIPLRLSGGAVDTVVSRRRYWRAAGARR